MKQIKDHDLVLLSGDKIDCTGSDNDIKRKTSLEFLKIQLSKPSVMFGFVTGKSFGNPKNPAQGLPSIDVLIDPSKCRHLKLSEIELSYSKMYIYVYDSLATTFREYKTIRMSEFYGMGDILLNPQPDSDKQTVVSKN